MVVDVVGILEVAAQYPFLTDPRSCTKTLSIEESRERKCVQRVSKRHTGLSEHTFKLCVGVVSPKDAKKRKTLVQFPVKDIGRGVRLGRVLVDPNSANALQDVTFLLPML